MLDITNTIILWANEKTLIRRNYTINAAGGVAFCPEQYNPDEIAPKLYIAYFYSYIRMIFDIKLFAYG